MPRRHSALDNLITLPWWFNLMLAAIVYVFLKFWLPSIEFQSPAFKGLATVIPSMAGIFASVLVFAAAMSALIAWRKGELLNKQTSITSVQNLLWRDFESVVGEACRHKGYSVHENTGSSPDGGIDLTLTKDGKTLLVQCKNWRNKPVGVSVVRELLGVVAAEGAAGGVIVCSGSFTSDAVAFARGQPIELIEGTKLVRLIGDVQSRTTSQPAPTTPAVSVTPAEPVCPKCGGQMHVKMARNGPTAGSKFWGCKQYPKCKGSRSLTS